MASGTHSQARRSRFDCAASGEGNKSSYSCNFGCNFGVTVAVTPIVTTCRKRRHRAAWKSYNLFCNSVTRVTVTAAPLKGQRCNSQCNPLDCQAERKEEPNVRKVVGGSAQRA